MNNRALDSLQWSSLDFPYNRMGRPLSEEPRLVDGRNSYVTYGGTIAKRPGTLKITNTDSALKCDRLWVYETLESPQKIFLVGSFFNVGTGYWELYYANLDTPTAWTIMPELRQSNHSTSAHEASVSRGKLYIKSYPTALSGEKLGSIIFDGTTITVTYWGLLGPQTPVQMTETIHRLTAALTSGATSFALDSVASYPATPFYVQIDYELILVTTIVGTTVTVASRAQGGTTAAAHASGSMVIYRPWTASAHNVTVNQYWEYTYAYVSKTGQVSNRAAVETNPDNPPSLTGPFFNLIPKFTVQGQADTTNVPHINIYRTTDGGGTFYLLEQITNSGAGSITYEDKSLVSSTGSHDPIPDINLDTSQVAPSLTSNSPPPTVLSPLVVGTDTPTLTTPITYYAGRFWFGIGNYLFYSAQEELNTGVPEESWPAGLAQGNFFEFQHPIQNLMGTTDALYIITSEDTHILTGTLRETFNPKQILSEVGAPYYQPRAICRYQDSVVWLTNDFRVAILQGNNFRIISDQLGTDIIEFLGNPPDDACDMTYWADIEKEWIVLNIYKTSSSMQWVYDIKKASSTKQDFWNTPWTIPGVTALLSGRISLTSTQRRLCFYLFNNTAPLAGWLVRICSTAAENVGSDTVPTGLSATFTFHLVTALFQIPPGNHVNALRRPDLTPVVYKIRIDRTKYSSDTDPSVNYFLDDLWTTPIGGGTPQTVPRAALPKGFSTLMYPIDTIAYRVAVEIFKSDTQLFELQDLVIVFEADKGM